MRVGSIEGKAQYQMLCRSCHDRQSHQYRVCSFWEAIYACHPHIPRLRGCNHSYHHHSSVRICTAEDDSVQICAQTVLCFPSVRYLAKNIRFCRINRHRESRTALHSLPSFSLSFCIRHSSSYLSRSGVPLAGQLHENR